MTIRLILFVIPVCPFLFCAFAHAQLAKSTSDNPPNDSGILSSNNRHHVTPHFEFFAEEPMFVSRMEIDPPAKSESKGQPAKPANQPEATKGRDVWGPRPLGTGRHKVFLMPGIYLRPQDVEVYDKRGTPVGALQRQLHAEVLATVKLSHPSPPLKSEGLKINTDKGVLANAGVVPGTIPKPEISLTPEQQRAYREAMDAKLEEVTYDAWIFFTLKPRILSRDDKREIISSLANFPRAEMPEEGATEEAVAMAKSEIAAESKLVDDLIQAYTFEDVALSGLLVKFSLGDKVLGEFTGKGVVTSNSTYMVKATDLTYAELKQLNAGLFSAEAECVVDLSRVAENSMIIDFGKLETAMEDYFYKKVIETRSTSKRRFLKRSTESIVSEHVTEQLKSRNSSLTNQSASFYSRDSSLSPDQIASLWSTIFPRKDVLLKDLIKLHDEKSKDASTPELQKTLHAAYVTFLNESVTDDTAKQNAAEDKLSDAFAKLGGGGSGANAKAEAAKAAWQFLKTGFSTANIHGSQSFEVRYLEDREYYEKNTSLLTVNSASTVTRQIRIVRADFREMMRVAPSVTKEYYKQEGRMAADKYLEAFDPGFVDPLEPLDKLAPSKIFQSQPAKAQQ